MYRALRDHDPVHHVVPGPDDRPDHDYYVLSRHADIWAAARDHQTFSSAQGLTVNYGELELIGLADNPPMVMQDPPVHTEFRKLVVARLHPAPGRGGRTQGPRVRGRARSSASSANGGGDIVAELFKPLPSMVVAHYLGVPEAGSRPVRRLDRRDRRRQHRRGRHRRRTGHARRRAGRDDGVLHRADRAPARRTRGRHRVAPGGGGSRRRRRHRGRAVDPGVHLHHGHRRQRHHHRHARRLGATAAPASRPTPPAGRRIPS